MPTVSSPVALEVPLVALGPVTDDVVVLLDEAGQPAGLSDRLGVHGDDTPLHLAFSSYLFDTDGRVLLTRRALSKRTWPGVWTNTCCGHPRPGEAFADAVARRVRDELGAGVSGLWCALPEFRYRATDASGVVENEICPVFVGRLEGTLAPHPDEVMDVAWVGWDDLVHAGRAVPLLLSPWSALQLPGLAAPVSRWLDGDRV